MILGLIVAATLAAAEPTSAIRILSADGTPLAMELVAGPARTSPAVAAAASKTLEPMPNLYQVPARCRDVPYHVVDQYGRPVATRLGDLPNAGALQLLVDRSIAGCRVITVKQGVVAPDRPNPPAESYRIRPLKPPVGKRTP